MMSCNSNTGFYDMNKTVMTGLFNQNLHPHALEAGVAAEHEHNSLIVQELIQLHSDHVVKFIAEKGLVKLGAFEVQVDPRALDGAEAKRKPWELSRQPSNADSCTSGGQKCIMEVLLDKVESLQEQLQQLAACSTQQMQHIRHQEQLLHKTAAM